MKQLIAAEWERLWQRKLTWLVFALLPIAMFAAATYLRSQNADVSPELAHYTVAGNFPVLGLSEMLPTLFNACLLTFASLVVTEEYRTGQLRLVMIRSFSFLRIMMAKWIVLALLCCLLLGCYFVLTSCFGWFWFEHAAEYPLFYHNEKVTVLEGMVYNLKFYGLALLTILATLCVFMFIAVLSHTTTSAIGLGCSFLLVSFFYPQLLGLLAHWFEHGWLIRLYFTSIPMIQWEGMTLMLAEQAAFRSWNFGVLAVYIVVFSLGILWVSRIKDRWL